jgi:hypothetical protein
VGKIDRSEGMGEIDWFSAKAAKDYLLMPSRVENLARAIAHFTLEGAVDYLLMPERIKALEGKISVKNCSEKTDYVA